MKDLIIKSLFDIRVLTNEFESALTKLFKLKDIPYNEAGHTFPKKGTIEYKNSIFEYKFHGAGCYIKKGKVILDYGISPITENKVKITPRNFMLFMKSYVKEKLIQDLTSQDIHLIFLELEKEKILQKRPESLANFEIVEEIEPSNSAD